MSIQVEDRMGFVAGYRWADEGIADLLRDTNPSETIRKEARERYKGSRFLTSEWEFITGAYRRLAEEDLPYFVEAAALRIGYYRRRMLSEKRKVPFPYQYVLVVTTGPFIYLRFRWSLPKPWKQIYPPLTRVMESHGLRRKDIYSLEAHDPDYTPDVAEFTIKLEQAFEGDPGRLPFFWLYDWKDGEFVLVREPAKR